MDLASRLHAAIEKVCPIAGVRIGRRDDKETWQIAFAEEATEEQRGAALDVLAGFDVEAPDDLLSPPASVTDDLAALKAVLIADGIITRRNWRRRSAVTGTRGSEGRLRDQRDMLSEG